MIKFQVTNPDIITRNWNDKVTGQPRSMRIQTLLAFLPDLQGKTDTYDKIEMILQDNQNPLPVGFYQLTPQCIYLDRNGRLQVGLSYLQPMQQKLATAT
jgi:hypothetical protein